MFAPDDIQRIDDLAVRLLADPGVRLEHDEVRRSVIGAGAAPGTETDVVRFPPAMVTERLAMAPRVVRLARLDRRVLEVQPGSPSIFWTGSGMNWIGPDNACREATSTDLAGWARLVDSLDSVDGIVGLSMSDVPPRHRDFVGLRVMAQNCRKHLRALSFTPAGVEAMRQMARVLAGGSALRDRPLFSMGFTAHGPLRWTNLALDIFLRSAGDGIPLMVNGEPVAGASGPVTLPGAMAVGHAEILAGIIVNQVLEPGRPIIHNLGFSHILDMRTASAVTSGPETCLLATAGAALARLHNLPSASWMCTDSMLPDEQAVIESTMAGLTHAAGGVSVVWGVGSLESEKSISPVKAVLDDEIVGMVRRFVRGVRADDESLAELLIRQVGIAGEFLSSEHTLVNFRSELHEPKLLCRVPRQRWADGGSKRLSERALERAESLLAAERPPLLDEATTRELLKIEDHYRAALVALAR